MPTEAELADVIAALRGGYRMQLGGGRSFSTYVWERERIVRIDSCDGQLEEHDCSDGMLRAAIDDAPHVFTQYVAWWKTRPPAPSWPPTPSVPTSIENAESTLRQNVLGPPPMGDDDPWSFIFRWPDAVVVSLVWPAVSRLLADTDPEVRERAIWFCKHGPVERERSFERLFEVATQRSDLFCELSHVDTLAGGLSDLSLRLPGERARVASVVLALLGDRLVCSGAVHLLAERDPSAVIERAPKWSEGLLDQIAAMQAASAIAMYRPDHLLALLGALRSRTPEQRQEILERLAPILDLTAENRALILNADGIALPERPCPTLDECRAALGLAS